MIDDVDLSRGETHMIYKHMLHLFEIYSGQQPLSLQSLNYCVIESLLVYLIHMHLFFFCQ